MTGSGTPTTCAGGLAGLARGPKKLNTERTPNSLRTGPAWRMAGWNTCAKQKAIPASATQVAIWSGARSTTTPRA